VKDGDGVYMYFCIARTKRSACGVGAVLWDNSPIRDHASVGM
jgi:hypothetical protein